VLVEHAREIPVPFAEGSRALLRNPEEWLPGAAAAAHRKERQLLAAVGFEVAHVRVEKKVRIEVISLERSSAKIVLLIRWEALHGAKLFPVFEGSLELASTGDNASRIALGGEYQPPGGAAGRAGDRSLLHHVAAATAKDFVDRVTRVLSSSADEAGGG
jgi:hypothetical protein